MRSLGDHLLRGNYHVFHYIGHGSFSEGRGDGVLALEDEEGRSRLASGERLAYLLGNHRSLRLVFLNACEGARTSQDDPFAGIAMTLMRTGGIPAVVAMQFSITEDAAIAFARGFYTALSTARPVDAAVTQGRMAIFSSDNDVEWGKPVLFMRAVDGILFDLQGIGAGEPARARLGGLYARAEELLAGGSWIEAIACCEEIRAIDAGYRDVGDLLARAREELARQAQGERLARSYREAMEAAVRHNWQEAIKGFRTVLELDPSHGGAGQQLALAQEQQEAEERAQREEEARQSELARLYRRAEARAQSAEWGEAAKLYGAVLALEPSYRDVEAKLAEAQRQQHLADRYAQALEHLQSQCWQEAIEGFRAIVEIDPNYHGPDHGNAAALLARARQEKERIELPSPPAAGPRRPTTLPE